MTLVDSSSSSSRAKVEGSVTSNRSNLRSSSGGARYFLFDPGDRHVALFSMTRLNTEFTTL